MHRIRIAEERDAKVLADLARETFVQTFSGLNTAEDMESYCRESYSEEIQSGEISDPDKSTVLYEIEGLLVGYAQINWNSKFEKIDCGSQVEIQRIYVKSRFHGKGIAKDLMKYLLNLVKTKDIKNVWLGVWEKNPRAIAFYKKMGISKN